MNFDDTPEEAAFRAEARAWLSANAKPKDPNEAGGTLLAERIDAETVRVAKIWQKKKADAGWACLRWPREYGGRGATAIQSVIWSQEEARFQTPPPEVFGIGIGMCGPTLLAHGTEEQKRRYLPKLVSGEEIWCQLFSEPCAGSDLAGLRTAAVRDAASGEWIVNGQKIWTTGAHVSDFGLLIARHDPDATKHAGLTCFVVDMHAPGIEVRPITQMNGGQVFNEVFFHDVRVPDANRIGGVGDGWRVAITTLMNERMAAGAGGGSGALRDLITLARTRERDGRPALADASVRHRIADFYARAKGLQYTSQRTLTALSRGRMPGPEASLGKLVGASLAQEMAAFAIELGDVAGVVADPEADAQNAHWTDLWLAIPGFRIAGGTDEVLRGIIAERVLGLPAQARADKGMSFRAVPTGTR